MITKPIHNPKSSNRNILTNSTQSHSPLTNDMCLDTGIVWIFGYGSLIWRPGFPYLRKFNGYIQHFQRVFYQLDTSHRGNEKQPGRVVTLVEKPNATCWGTCFCVTQELSRKIFENLDTRESGGYMRKLVPVYVNGSNCAVVTAYVYMVDPKSPSFSVADKKEIAKTIATSVGSSGPNRDYLFNLAKAMRELSVDDVELFELEKMVLDLIPLVSLDNGKLKISSTKVKEGVVIDDGAVQAISNRGKSLLPVGVVDVTGEFEEKSVICIYDKLGKVVSKGISNYNSVEIKKILGLHSRKIPKVLGHVKCECIVDKQNMILV